MDNGYRVKAEARYEYTDPESGEYLVLRVPEEVEQWLKKEAPIFK